MKYLTVGLSHKTAPLDLREKLAFSPEKVKRGLSLLLAESLAPESLILSTCNRVEIYGVSPEPEGCVQGIKAFLSRFHGLPEGDLEPFLYERIHEEAVLHGFRVAAGLDSMVVGESQIFGQMKEAYRMAQEAGSAGPHLNRYIHRVFQAAKKIRSETEIGSLPLSVSYVAVLLAKKIFGSLEGRKALLLGAGKMSELAALHLKSQGSPPIWVANRSFEKAESMAAACGGQAVHFNDFKMCLPLVDVVITSTAAEDYLIRPDDIHEAMRLRKNKPMFIIDIAVPRNVDPAVHRIFNVYLYDLDDLQGMVETNLKGRREKAVRAEAMASEEAASFLEGLGPDSAVLGGPPTAQRLAQKFEQLRRRELEKALSRLKDLNQKEKEVVEGLTLSIVNKILHDPLLALKTVSDLRPDPSSADVHEIIQKLFRLDDTDDSLGSAK